MSGPGLQPERTDLAWNRTALAAAGCAVLLLQVATRHGLAVAELLPAVLATALALVLALLGRRSTAPPVPRPRVLLLVDTLLMATCLTAFPVAI